MSSTAYSEDFFASHNDMSISSAKEVIPVIKKYVQPKSVIDIGCGNGTWLKAWSDTGLGDFKGVDGDYVKKDQLQIPPEKFEAADLAQPYLSGRKYDLVCSLEVGEHIQSDKCPVYVRSLCGLSDVIVFSAAIPGQGGTYHINEQYPGYWQALFDKEGYVAIDCLRSEIWNNPRIAWWYRQNILFFVRKESLSRYPELQKRYELTNGVVLPLVHPELMDIKHRYVRYFRKISSNPFFFLKYQIRRLLKGKPTNI